MSKTKLTLGTSRDILLTKHDRYYTIRETDWNRLKRLVDTCKMSIEWWSVFASVLFGIAGSAVLTAITLLNDDVSSLKLVVWTIAGATLSMGILCVVASSGKRKEKNNKIEEVQNTIKEIESQLLKES